MNCVTLRAPCSAVVTVERVSFKTDSLLASKEQLSVLATFTFLPCLIQTRNPYQFLLKLNRVLAILNFPMDNDITTLPTKKKGPALGNFSV